VLLWPGVAGSQSARIATNGWKFDNTGVLTDVLVGDVVEGTRLVDKAQVDVKATVRVVRVLQGALAPGTDLTLAWQYTALGSTRPTAGSLAGVRGLWFLRKGPEGFAIQRVGELSEGGDYFLELPANLPPGGALHLPDRSLPSKIAEELAGALQTLAAQDPKGPPRLQFRHLADALEALDRKKTATVYRYLSLQPGASLKMLGIEGRMAAGDASAVLELERDLPQLAHAPFTGRTPPLGKLNLAQNLPAAHAAARIALTDITLPGWESQLPGQIALMQSLEFLPYLNVMLDSPQPLVRAGAVRAFCQLGKSSSLWQADMQASCPSGLRFNDAAAERQAIEFWRRWYTGHRSELAKVATLPEVAAPARYSAPRGPAMVEVPVETRFLRVVLASARVFDHPQAAGGDTVAVTLPGRAPRFIDQLNSSDREIFHRAVDLTNAQLERIAQLPRDDNAAPDPKNLADRAAQRRAVLQSGLADLEKQLSPDGWKALEAEMTRVANASAIPMGGGRPATPPR
jgi:hypothetical protein